MLSDEHLADTPSDADTDDFSVPDHLPWVRVATEMVTGLCYSCRHQQFCQPNCYKRLMRACNRLVKAVKTVRMGASRQTGRRTPSFANVICIVGCQMRLQWGRRFHLMLHSAGNIRCATSAARVYSVR